MGGFSSHSPARPTACVGGLSDGPGSGKKPSWLFRDHLTLAEFAELDEILAEFGRNPIGLEVAAEIMQLPIERLAACAERNALFSPPIPSNSVGTPAVGRDGRREDEPPQPPEAA